MVRMQDRGMGCGIMLIDRWLFGKVRVGPRWGARLTATVRRARWTVTEAGCLDGKRSGRGKHSGSVR